MNVNFYIVKSFSFHCVSFPCKTLNQMPRVNVDGYARYPMFTAGIFLKIKIIEGVQCFLGLVIHKILITEDTSKYFEIWVFNEVPIYFDISLHSVDDVPVAFFIEIYVQKASCSASFYLCWCVAPMIGFCWMVVTLCIPRST